MPAKGSTLRTATLIWPFIDETISELNTASDSSCFHLRKVCIIEILDTGLQDTVYDDLHSFCTTEDHAKIAPSLNIRGKSFSSSLAFI